MLRLHELRKYSRTMNDTKTKLVQATKHNSKINECFNEMLDFADKTKLQIEHIETY